MHRFRCAALLSTLLVAAGGGPCQAPPAASPPATYVAHEWGTFTSMVGTDGIVLDGLHHEEEALPAFVHDLLKVREYEVDNDSKLPASKVTQKMETPVIYFYADQPLQARVFVYFAKGLMTQFYPLPDTVMPQLELARQQRVDMSKVDMSSLAWDIDILPRSGKAPAEIPPVGAEAPWSFARQTGASWVRTRPAPGSPAKAEAEHYLFYRGLGRWQPAVELASTGDRAAFSNRMPQAIPFAVALELGDRGGRFVIGGEVASGAAHSFDLGGAPWQPDRERFARQVGAAVEHALVARGLFVDEARAMVATWSRSWFQKDGARIVYVMPREQVDQVLPLVMDPAPKELLRVLVGRLEFITPAAQQRVEKALLDRTSGDATILAAAENTLHGLDRFLEPHLRNVAKNGTNAAVRGAAEAMLAAQAH